MTVDARRLDLSRNRLPRAYWLPSASMLSAFYAVVLALAVVRKTCGGPVVSQTGTPEGAGPRSGTLPHPRQSRARARVACGAIWGAPLPPPGEIAFHACTGFLGTLAAIFEKRFRLIGVRIS
jgi:hypothetical protein